MPVEVKIGDIFDSKAQTLVNTVNLVGVMGKGIALGFKQRFPNMYQDYLRRCKRGQVRLGQPYLYAQLEPPWIINFPTKDHWRSVAKLSDIARGLQYLVDHHSRWGLQSLAVPPLGCGEGQLDWQIVGPTLFRYLSRLTVPVELYAPYGTPQEQLTQAFLSDEGHAARAESPAHQRITPGMVVLVETLARLEREPYHWPVGRVMFQKIAYFLSEDGVETELVHEKGSYGPFTPGLRATLTRLVNNGLLVERRKGNRFEIGLGPTYLDGTRTYQNAIDASESQIERVVDLFSRLSTRQAETAATVHFAARQLTREHSEPPTETAVFNYVRDWKVRRNPPITDVEIARAVRNLAMLGWIIVRPAAALPHIIDDEELALA